ncbi:hypothetical protein GCM10011487_65780 [Steroidobacter agaridevorans]|uniref:Uncharacterized protein n=1 Tax=Steroidobacter agaridevorans TaxID=2695856 RepID=A0A829YPL8_9GAMM|nr:hypothetical protein GCM10011487_65780 [Steroidobacter agaridevorans]GFE90977.1 hypothetical protein GCM10011488_59310 [Steroidobacter agaridevorans]
MPSSAFADPEVAYAACAQKAVNSIETNNLAFDMKRIAARSLDGISRSNLCADLLRTLVTPMNCTAVNKLASPI